LRQLKGVKGIVKSVAFSRDGTRIVTGEDPQNYSEVPLGTPGAATVWDAETGEALVHLKGLTQGVDGVALSPDGTRIVTTGSSPAARTLLPTTGSMNSELKVWDARTGEVLLDLTRIREEPDWTDQRGCVAFSPDGTRFVTGGIRNGENKGDTATVRDTETGKVLLELEHGRGITCLAYSLDGTRIVTCSGLGMVKEWDAQTGKLLPLALKGHKGTVRSVTFSAYSQRIVTGGADGSVRVWDARTGTSLLDLKGYLGSIESVAIDPDGTRIVAAERESGVGARRSDKKTADAVSVWDARPSKPHLTLKGSTGLITDMTFSPDGTRIVTGGSDGTAKVWDTGTGVPQLELKTHTDRIASVSFSLDGTRIVTGRLTPDEARESPGSAEKTTKVWDARTGQELPGEAIPTRAPNKRISPDGRLFAFTNWLSADAEILPWKLDDEERAYRRILTRPELWRDREGYESARVALDEFAARFYIQRLPPAERPVLEAQFGWDRELAAGRERDAVPHLAILSAASPHDLEMALKVGALQAWFGMDEAYAATCVRSLTFAKGLSDPKAMQVMARICCVRPTADKARQEAVLALARKAVELDKKNLACRLALGMAEYRSGHFAEADAALIALKEPGVGAFYRAMSLHRQGKKDEARKLATEAAARLRNIPLPRDEKKPLEGGHRPIAPNALIMWLTYKEAKALIGFDEAPPEKK
jgi:WD40 repeat protein